MRNLIFILITGLITGLTYPVAAQQLTDSLTKGKIYNVITYDNNEVTGILEDYDSFVITLRVKNKIYKINTVSVQSIMPVGKEYNDFVPDTNKVNASINVNEQNFDKNKKPDYDAIYDVFLSSADEILASQKTLKHVSVKEVCDNEITFRDKFGTAFKTPVEEIYKINVIKNPASVLPATIICGSIVGGLMGVLIGQASEPQPQPGQFFSGMFSGLATLTGGIIGVLAGGLTGTALGFIISQDEEYDMYNLTKSKRIERLKNIIY